MEFTAEELQAWKKGWKQKLKLSMNTRFAGRILLNAAQTPPTVSAGTVALSVDGKELEVLPTSVTPLAEDFYEVEYRALSAAMIEDRYIDFSDAEMLKRSVGKLDQQTVFKDHEVSVDNWVGRVIATKWDEGYEGYPKGINAVLSLDTVKDPMTVRGVAQGAIHSASVTVSFAWKPSHTKLMDEGRFFDYLGQEVDGDLVRVIATEIESFWEISLVWQGADQYAKQIGGDGKPVHQTKSFKQLSTSKEGNPMETYLELLKKMFGASASLENVEELMSEKLEASKLAIQTELSSLKSDLAAVTTALGESKDKVVALELQAKTLEADAALGKKYLEDERASAVKLCKLVKGEKVNAAILKTLETGDLEVVQAWSSEFKAEFEQKVPARCGKCNSTEITRQSSLTAKLDSEDSPTDYDKDALKRANTLHS